MDNETKEILLNLIVFDKKEEFIYCLNSKEHKTKVFELLDDIKPYLTQYLKDNGVFNEEAIKIALQNALDFEQVMLEKDKEEMEKQKNKICDLEKKIKELGVEL